MMNINTVAYVSYVAGMAASKVQNGVSLKKVCEWVKECCDEVETPVDDFENVDFKEACLRLQYLINENRKERMIYNCEGIVKNMFALRVELVPTQH